MTYIKDLIAAHPRISGKVSPQCLHDILTGLDEVKSVPGAVVELGCNVGTASLFIRRYLDETKDHREFHVYDSWQGLPPRGDEDGEGVIQGGDARTRRAVFERHFAEAGLDLPIIHDGWFADAEYPVEIAFAFFDGDFYSSIIDSFEAVWPRLSPGGVIVVHDYEYSDLPGVKAAVRDFLEPRGVAWTKGKSHTCRVVKDGWRVL